MSLIFSTIPGASGSSKTSFSSISRCSKSFFLLQYVYNYCTCTLYFVRKYFRKYNWLYFRTKVRVLRRYLFYYEDNVQYYCTRTTTVLYTYTYKRIVHVHKFRDEIVKLHYCSKMDCTVRVGLQRCTRTCTTYMHIK